MCQFASGFLKPSTMEAQVADLNGHGETQALLKLQDGPEPDGWREFHYLPTGEIAVRVLEQDSHTYTECGAALRDRWPHFVDFLVWAINQPSYIPNDLYLSGLTDAKGLKLPETVGGSLDLGGLTDAKGLKLPETVGGSLDLGGLTDAKGLKLPETVGGYLDLRGKTYSSIAKAKAALGIK